MQSVAEVLAPMNVPLEQSGMKVSPAPMVSTTSVEKPGTLTSAPPCLKATAPPAPRVTTAILIL